MHESYPQNSPQSLFGADALLRGREIAIREMSFLLWKEVAAVVGRMDPSKPLNERAIATIGLRGDRGMMQRMITLARGHEGDLAALHMEQAMVFQVFDRLMDRAQSMRIPKPDEESIDRVDVITKRVLSGNGEFRSMDFDLSEDDIDRIRAALEEANRSDLLGVFNVLIGQRNKMITALERDMKFPALYNSVCFRQKVENLPHRIGVFVFADIADFKSMNDEYFGYDFVDTVVLQTVCSAIAREFPLSSRFGGDEFLVFEQGQPDQAVIAAKFAQVIDAALRSITVESVRSRMNLIPEQCRSKHWQQEDCLEAVVARLQNAHMKIGTSFSGTPAGRSYDELKIAAEDELKRAAKAKNRLRYPASCERSAQPFSALTGDQNHA